ncbi:MAG: pyruvate kinase [Bryobacteraceae bacterium]
MQSQLNRIRSLKERLQRLDDEMVGLEAENPAEDLHDEHLRGEDGRGARNLLHYMALRRHDIRDLQQELASLGLSSLGRTESHVRASIGAVLRVLTHLSKYDDPALAAEENRADLLDGPQLLALNTEKLLGPLPKGRRVRVMVTMPSEAATNYTLVRNLLASGMNCMRINCAHDGPEEWAAMIRQLRRAEAETGVRCKVEMDMAGPKLRTGPIEPGPVVVKYRPARDCFGRVTEPAKIWLTPARASEPAPGPANACLPLPARWLARLEAGTKVRFVDTRGSKREMQIRERVGRSFWAEAKQTAYVAPGLVLTAAPKGGRKEPITARVGSLAVAPQTVRLEEEEILILTRNIEPGSSAKYDGRGKLVSNAQIGVTLPDFFDCVQAGEPIWFDDGKIGGVITKVKPEEVEVRISQARTGGEKLGAEKGINIPDTDLRTPALTAEDSKALEFITANADIVGFSFVGSAADVRALRARLVELGREDIGILLKIETRRGFENLPPILIEAMRGGAVGVMIARGDLAVECGFERLAEIQEEILWIAESAYVPVVWATQVLETLAKTGRPSRSEITDAAMGARAECVMLNKGPYIVEAVQALDDILRRMEEHQEKKTARLRKLQVAAAFAGKGED